MEEAVDQELALPKAVPNTALCEERLHAQARAFLRASKAPSTLKAYRSDWQHFGTAQPGKTPLLTADLIQVLAHLPSCLAGVRDRALLLVGYTGGLRCSELAAFTVEDLAWVPEGAVLTLRRSKTDQAGQGRKVALPRGAHAVTCPVTALR